MTGRNCVISKRDIYKSALFCVALSLNAIGTATADNQSICSSVYITISSLTETANNLELNWDTQCGPNVPEWVGLFEVDPSVITTATPIVKVFADQYPTGYYKTNVTTGVIVLPGGWNRESVSRNQNIVPGPNCLPFWIASFKGDDLLDVNCLKIQPTWMNDKREQLSGIPLSKLLIPGTHNSGSYYSSSSLTKGEGLHRFVLTQDNDIWTQLVFGIRYLDFRIGYYPPLDSVSESYEDLKTVDEIYDDRFWINHDLVKLMPLVPLLRDIKKFIELAKGEIIILDIHRLPVGFYTSTGQMKEYRHKMLIDLLHRELGDVAANFKDMSPQSRSNLHLLNGPRAKDIWASDKRVIICYPEESITKDAASWLWPAVKQLWGDKQRVSDLKKYIQAVLSNPGPSNNIQGNPLKAIMAQLTPNALEILFNPANNLRKMADSVNRELTNWVKDDWWKKANIIATDFYLGNNLIELSINSIPHKTIFVNED